MPALTTELLRIVANHQTVKDIAVACKSCQADTSVWLLEASWQHLCVLMVCVLFLYQEI